MYVEMLDDRLFMHTCSRSLQINTHTHRLTDKHTFMHIDIHARMHTGMIHNSDEWGASQKYGHPNPLRLMM